MKLKEGAVKRLELSSSSLEEASKYQAEVSRANSEAKCQEREAFYSIFKEKGILFDCTVVKSKSTGTLGVVSLIDSRYGGRAHFYTVEFFPLKKNGEVRMARSVTDSPNFGMRIMWNAADDTHTYKGSAYKEELFPEYIDKVVSEGEIVAMYITGIAEQFESMGYTVCENKRAVGNHLSCSRYPCELKEGETE